MVRRMDIVGARRGEIFFARTIAVLVQIGAGATIYGAAMFDGLGEWILLVHVGAKNISPVHPWCGGAWRARDHTVRAMAHQSRTDG